MTIVLRGDLDFLQREALQAQLVSATARSHVTIDLSEVRFLDASALGCFIHLYNAMRDVHPKPVIRLVGLRPHLATIFRVTGLDSIFDLIAVRSTRGQTL